MKSTPAGAAMAMATLMGFVVGCGSSTTATSPSGSSFQTAPLTSSATPLSPDVAVALAQRVYPLDGHGGYGMCHDPTQPNQSCPYTSRLSTRVASNPFPDGIEECRCTSGSAGFAATADSLSSTGGVVHVTLTYDTYATHFDLIIVNSNGTFAVDDIQCSGKGPSTSLYASSVPSCD